MQNEDTLILNISRNLYILRLQEGHIFIFPVNGSQYSIELLRCLLSGSSVYRRESAAYIDLCGSED